MAINQFKSNNPFRMTDIGFSTGVGGHSGRKGIGMEITVRVSFKGTPRIAAGTVLKRLLNDLLLLWVNVEGDVNGLADPVMGQPEAKRPKTLLIYQGQLVGQLRILRFALEDYRSQQTGSVAGWALRFVDQLRELSYKAESEVDGDCLEFHNQAISIANEMLDSLKDVHSS